MTSKTKVMPSQIENPLEVKNLPRKDGTEGLTTATGRAVGVGMEDGIARKKWGVKSTHIDCYELSAHLWDLEWQKEGVYV